MTHSGESEPLLSIVPGGGGPEKSVKKRGVARRPRLFSIGTAENFGRFRGDPAPRRRTVPPVPRPVCDRFRLTNDPDRWFYSGPSRRETKAILPGCALPFADHRSGRPTLLSVDPVQDLELFDSLFLPFPPAALEDAPFVPAVLSVPLLVDLLDASWSALAAFLYDSLR